MITTLIREFKLKYLPTPKEQSMLEALNKYILSKLVLTKIDFDKEFDTEDFYLEPDEMSEDIMSFYLEHNGEGARKLTLNSNGTYKFT